MYLIKNFKKISHAKMFNSALLHILASVCILTFSLYALFLCNTISLSTNPLSLSFNKNKFCIFSSMPCTQDNILKISEYFETA